MKNILCIVSLLVTALVTEAQFTVNFKLGSYPLPHAGDSIFIAGNFNKWNPGNSAYSLSSAGEKASSFFIRLDTGYYEYKATRGSWDKVECLNYGVNTDNHDFEVRGDTTIIVDIEAWKDDFASTINKPTAGENVHVIDTAFFMPQLNSYRRIQVYLPADYAGSRKRYQVLYMHDGQNLFDASTSAFGEWGVDECLDTLISKGKPGCIVVGIDNGPRRMNEYNPYDFGEHGKGEADAYLTFLTRTLKPFIDKKYRTLTGKENTIIAGSSMGGLVSYYAMLKHPEVFGKAGIFSPSFWTAPRIKGLTDSLAPKLNGRFFFYCGEKEGMAFVQQVVDMQDALGLRSSALIYSVIDPNGRHNENAWRKWFPEFYTWIIGDGFNTVIKVDK
jgi:predicted alpha/beta superfamily hydrolase